MNETPIIIKKADAANANADANAARIAELEAKLAASQKAEEASKKRMQELEEKIRKDKEAKKQRQEEERADKAELAALKKALSSKLGEIDILARTMIEESKRRPQGWTRKELLSSYLAALGMDEAHEKAPLKEATLNAQTGARIQPRLEKLGYKLARAASDMGKALYICLPLKS